MAQTTSEFVPWLIDVLDRRLSALGALEEIAEMERILAVETTLRVSEARDSGESWEQIGAVLGMTKQAAHKRFS